MCSSSSRSDLLHASYLIWTASTLVVTRAIFPEEQGVQEGWILPDPTSDQSMPWGMGFDYL